MPTHWHTRRYFIEYDARLLTITDRETGQAMSFDARLTAWKDARQSFSRYVEKEGPTAAAKRWIRVGHHLGLKFGPMYKPGRAPRQPAKDRTPRVWQALRNIGMSASESDCILSRAGCEASDFMGGRAATIRHAVRVYRRNRKTMAA